MLTPDEAHIASRVPELSAFIISAKREKRYLVRSLARSVRPLPQFPIMQSERVRTPSFARRVSGFGVSKRAVIGATRAAARAPAQPPRYGCCFLPFSSTHAFTNEPNGPRMMQSERASEMAMG